MNFTKYKIVMEQYTKQYNTLQHIDSFELTWVYITVNKKSKTIILKTNYEFTKFEIDKHGEYFHFDFIKNKNKMISDVLYFNKFNGRKYYPNQIQTKYVDFEDKTVYLSYF